MPELDEFTAAYLRAMFWTELAHYELPAGPFEDIYTESEYLPRLDAGDLREALADCARFQVKTRALLLDADDADSELMESAGADFWLTRNGHGVGFWSRPEMYGDTRAEYLNRIASSFGEVWVHIEPATEDA